VYTGTVSTGSEGIKQHEILTIRGNRVRAGQVPMSAIDGVQSVFSLGLFGVSHGQGETMLEDAGECNHDWNCFRFHQVSWGCGLQGHGLDTKFDSTRK